MVKTAILLLSPILANECHYEFTVSTQQDNKPKISYKFGDWYRKIELKNGQNYLEFSDKPCPEKCPLSDIMGKGCTGCYSKYPFNDPSNKLLPKPKNITSWFLENVKNPDKWIQNYEDRLGCCCGDCWNYTGETTNSDKTEFNRCINSENMEDQKTRCSKSRDLWENDATHEYYQVCSKSLCVNNNEADHCADTDNPVEEGTYGTIIGVVVVGGLVLGLLFFLAYYFIKDKHQPSPGIQDTELLR